MSDLISRQAVIDALKNERSDWNDDYNVPIDYCIDAINSLPSVQPERWIPVSERLPDTRTEVIVSCTDDSGDTKFRYTSSGWVTTDKEYWIVDDEINNFVVAWREMPEPYKGEQE